MRHLVWFRADLRAHDNAALYEASRAALEANETEHGNGDGKQGVVAAFTICPKQWLDEHHWADIKVDFILRHLEKLRDQLEHLNIPLKIVTTPEFDSVPGKLLELARQTGCSALCFNREYEWNEARRDEAVRDTFEDAGLRVRSFTDQTLWEPGDVRTNSGGYYSVYSPFKRKCYERWNEGDVPQIVPSPKKQPKIDVESDDIPQAVEGFRREDRWADLWAAGEDAANGRLGAFIGNKLEAYKDDRDEPALDATSVISPYLTVGSISPRRCVHAAIDANRGLIHKGNAGAVHWISEVLWREFYKHILVGFPRVSRGRAFQEETETIDWKFDQGAFDAWCEGRTGVPIVDAGMRQLQQVGWMHNRVRMIAAMFLTKDLFIDWRLGEKFFMRHLIDGDLASNNGGWQWSASTGTDAAPYFRIMNPYSQSKRNDPDGAYIRRWVPELADLAGAAVHEPHTLRDKNAGALFDELDYPEPIAEHKPAREHAISVFKNIKGSGAGDD